MLVPSNETQFVNRIGLGVVTEDPGGASLAYLRTVRSEMRAILDISRQMASVRLPRVPGVGRTASAQRSTQEASAGRQRVQEESRQLSLLDRLQEAHMERRVARERGALSKSLAYQKAWGEEYLAQVRRLSDTELHIRAAAASGRDQHLEDEISRRRAVLRPIEMTPEEQARARQRLRPMLGQGQGIRFGRSPISPLDEGQVAQAEVQMAKWRAQFVKSQQRRAAKEDFDLEQRLSSTPGREAARLEGERSAAAQEALRKRTEREEVRRRVAEADAKRQAGERAARRNEEARSDEYRRGIGERLRGATTGELRAGVGQLRGKERDELTTFHRDSLALELRRRRDEARVKREEEERRRAAEEVRRVQREREAADKRIVEERERYGPVSSTEGRAYLDRLRRQAERKFDPDSELKRQQAKAAIEGGMEVRARGRGGRGGPASDPEKEIGRASDALRKFNAEAQRTSLRRAGTEIGNEAAAISRRLTGLQRIASNLREEFAKPANMGRTRELIEGDLRRIGQRVKAAENQLRGLREAEQKLGPSGAGTTGPRPDPQSTGSIFQRIIRNMAIRAAVFYALYDLKRFTTDSIEAARVAAQTERQLEATARQSGLTMRSALGIGEQIRGNADLSRQEAQATTANVIRFARRAGGQGQEGAFSRAIADIAAQRNIENKDLAGAVDKLFRGEGVEEILGREPEALFRQYAQRQLAARPDVSGLFVGKERPDLRPMNQQIAEYVSHLSDAQKAQIIWNETLRAGGEAVGEAARRHATLEGRLDAARSRWADAHVSFGNFILLLRPVDSLLESIVSRLNGLNTDKLRLIGSGSRGELTPHDAVSYAQAHSESAAARANTLWEGYGGAIETAGGIGLAALLAGRGVAKPAVEGGRTTLAQTARAGLARIFKGMESAVASAADAAGYEVEASALGGGAGLAAGAVGAVGLLIVGITAQWRRQAEAALARETAYTVAEVARLGQLNAARAKGETRYFVAGVRHEGGDEYSREEWLKRFPEEQRRRLMREGRAVEVIGPAKPSDEQQDWQRRAERVGLAGYQSARDRDTIEKAERSQNDFWNTIHANEEEQRKKLASAQSDALAKLRDFVQGSFRVVEEVAQATAAPGNPFTKIFTDGATAAQRMQQQWGFLGKATVAYFTDLETGATKLRLTEERFRALAASQELVSRAEAEADERRYSPDLTRYEKQAQSQAQAAANAALQLPELLQRFRTTLAPQTALGLTPELARRQVYERGQNIYDREGRLVRGSGVSQAEAERRVQRRVGQQQAELALQQLSGLESVLNLGQGLAQQGQRAINNVVGDAVLGLLEKVPPEILRHSPRLSSAFAFGIRAKAADLQGQVQDEAQRARLLELERQRLLREVRETGQLRQREEQSVYGEAIKAGRGTMFEGRFVGQLSSQERRRLNRLGGVADEALIRITDRLSPRELGADLFGARNEAIRREADRRIQTESDALNAALASARYLGGEDGNGGLMGLAKEIRDAVIGGSYAVAIQVTNDTQARIDQEALTDANSGVPAPFRSNGRGPSPYTSSTERYGRGGRKR